MSLFVFVTVDGNASQISALRRILSVAGFQQSLTAANDATYHLPANQYLIDSPMSQDAIAACVQRAALAAGCRHCKVLLAKVANCANYEMHTGK